MSEVILAKGGQKHVSGWAVLALLEILEGRSCFAKASGVNDFFAQRKKVTFSLRDARH